MIRNVPVRYRFVVKFDGNSAGLGIERLGGQEVTSFWSIHIAEDRRWAKSLIEVLAAERQPFDIAYDQKLKAEDIDELHRLYSVKRYTNRHRLTTCKQLAMDAIERKTTITEVLIDET